LSRATDKALRKKIRPEHSEGGDFFTANPQGLALSGSPGSTEICAEKADHGLKRSGQMVNKGK